MGRNIKPVMTLVGPAGPTLDHPPRRVGASPVPNDRDPTRIPGEQRRTPPDASHRARRGVAGLPDASLGVEAEQEERTEHEEDDQREDRRAVGPAELEDQPEQQRPEPRGAPLRGVVEAEVLTFTSPRDEQAEERPGQRL